MSFTLIKDDGLYEEIYGETGGPDYNLGKEYSKSFTWKNDETGSFATAVSTYYVNARDEETGEDIDWTDYQEIVNRFSELDEDEQEDGLGILFYVSEQTETVSHEDEEDPWESGNSDYEYGEGSYLFYHTLEDAEQEAKRMAQREWADFYAPENI